jgi:hypothetical protein
MQFTNTALLAIAAASQALANTWYSLSPFYQPHHTLAICSPFPHSCFSLTALNGPDNAHGTVGQLIDGQNRIGQTNLPMPKGTYCLPVNGDGGIYDSKHRGCILTPPTTQWQCDEGAKPTKGFSVSNNGTLLYEGASTFWTCPTGDHGGWYDLSFFYIQPSSIAQLCFSGVLTFDLRNLYSKPVEGQLACAPVSLYADNCVSACI